MKIYYRISNNSYKKNRLGHATKEHCLENFLNEFDFPENNIEIIADNVTDLNLKNFVLSKQKNNIKVEETSLNNAHAFRHCLRKCCDVIKDDEYVYFVEDDYLHLPKAFDVLKEGLDISDYVTLYDHPDKYRASNMPLNPYAKMNQYSESTEVIEGPLSIWRTTNSTTMSFALNGKTLKEDQDIWSITKTMNRDVDFDIFCVLTKQKTLLKKRFLKQIPFKFSFRKKPRRYLGVSIPGNSLHLEQSYLRPQDISRFLES